MIDSHCHMLPGIDDGAKDLDYALSMAELAVASGITHTVLTPHHNDGMYTNMRGEILKACEAFKEQLELKNIPLKVIPGSELHVAAELPAQLAENTALTYADKRKAALLELPKHTIPAGSEGIIENVFYQGITPVIAHPERNATLANKPDMLGEWFEEGWKFQLTNQSCSGEFGKDIQKVCRYWVKKGWVHIIATDAHRTQRRAPDMRKGVEAIRKWAGDEVATLLSLENPNRLILGEELHSIELKEKPKRKWFW